MKDKICISIDKSVLIAMKEKAKEENRTLSNYINMVLKDIIELEKEKIERGN